MARVEWSRQSGDDTEAVIAIMLCREYPNAIRPKPSQGDGGIDVLVPGEDGAAIYQIKGYTGNLTATRKGHIKKSWDQLLKFSKAKSLAIAEWHLVVPENFTNEQREWLDGLTKNAGFPCHLHTLDYVDGLAAKYPDVIDYYLRDGKDRLGETIRSYLSIVSPDTSTEPAGSLQRISELHKTLNKFDPHYSYDYSVDTLRPGQASASLPADAPGLVAAVQLTEGDTCITYKIFARFAEALNERPIPGGFTLIAERDSELGAQIEDWVKFGAPLKDIPAKNIFTDLPGGFATNVASGFVSLRASGPIPEAVSEVTLLILDPDSGLVESLDFTTDEVTTGHDRSAVRTTAHESRAGIVTFEIRMAPGDKDQSISLKTGDFTGKRPADVLPSLRFIAALRAPRRLQVAIKDGPVLIPPSPITIELLSEADGQNMVAACEALAQIQRAVFLRVTIPDLASTTWDALESWVNAAALLRGEELTGTWQGAKVHLAPGSVPTTGVGALFNRGPWPVQIGSNTFSIGLVDINFAAGRIDETRPAAQHEDHLDVYYIPAGTDAMSMRMAPKTVGPVADQNA